MMTNAFFIEWEEIDKLFYRWMSDKWAMKDLSIFLMIKAELDVANPVWVICLYVCVRLHHYPS